MTLLPRTIELLKENGLDDILVFGGGIIPDQDVPELKRLGVRGIFGPGTSTDTIVDFIREEVSRQQAAETAP
jgi:methylmalonyl-CoA mutase C-terminal domain/subunit